MNRFILHLSLFIGVCGYGLYAYIDKQNLLTELRIEIPGLAKEIKGLKEENTRLQYEIDLFESPEHLLQLAKSSEYSHLKHPLVREIMTLEEGVALALPLEEQALETSYPKPRLPLAAK